MAAMGLITDPEPEPHATVLTRPAANIAPRHNSHRFALIEAPFVLLSPFPGKSKRGSSDELQSAAFPDNDSAQIAAVMEDFCLQLNRNSRGTVPMISSCFGRAPRRRAQSLGG
jgi:hypothetical protein